MIKIFGSKPQKQGEKGEEIAVNFLKKNGFKVIERNVPNKYGEIDIVAIKDKIYYFFEVKTGVVGSGINPAENLTGSKIRKFLVSVEHYELIHNIRDYRVQGILVLQKPDGTYVVETIGLF